MSAITNRCPACGWDGNDLCRAVVPLRNENAAREARMAKLEEAARLDLLAARNGGDAYSLRRLEAALAALDAETEAG